MKHLKLFGLFASFALLVLAGCSGSDSGTPEANSDTPAEAKGKPGEMKGMSPDQVGVTDAGKKADSMTGSKAGGG